MNLADARTAIIHALRGWPTPFGVTFNPSASKLYNDDGGFTDPRDAAAIQMMVEQVMSFAAR